MASTPSKHQASRASRRRRLQRLLQQRPLPLRTLVKAISADPALAALVLRVAADQCCVPPADVESAVVLLGAEGLRDALAPLPARGNKAVAKPRTTLPNAGRLRAIRKAIANHQYRVDPHAVAAAMLRELERS